MLCQVPKHPHLTGNRGTEWSGVAANCDVEKTIAVALYPVCQDARCDETVENAFIFGLLEEAFAKRQGETAALGYQLRLGLRKGIAAAQRAALGSDRPLCEASEREA